MQTERFPGLQSFQSLIDVMLRRLAADHVVERLWSGDASLWHPSADTQQRIKQRLGWLELPVLGDPTFDPWIESVRESGCTFILIVATGDAAASVRLWRSQSSSTSNTPNIAVLDTIDPHAAHTTLDGLDMDRTAVVFLGIELTLELKALCTLVLTRLDHRGLDHNRLLLVSAPTSPFAQWLRQQGVSRIVELPSTISERFGALSALGWIPAFLYDHDAIDGVQSARRMYHACHETTDLMENPGVWLGVVLGVLAQQGRDILTLVASPALAPLADWIASFVAGSLSKHRRGFVPVVDELLVSTEQYRPNRIFLHLSLVSSVDHAVASQLEALEAAGHPVLRYKLANSNHIAAENARWQVAVAVAATIIGLNPFDEPDTVAMRQFMQRRLDEGVFTAVPSTSVPEYELSSLLEHNQGASYLALVCYFEPSNEMVRQLNAIRTRLQQRYSLATVLIYPLRDQTASAQLLHAGRDNGIILALRTERERDLELSDAAELLAMLCRTRLDADLIGWQGSKRSHLVLELGSNIEAGLRRLHSTLDQM